MFRTVEPGRWSESLPAEPGIRRALAAQPDPPVIRRRVPASPSMPCWLSWRSSFGIALLRAWTVPTALCLPPGRDRCGVRAQPSRCLAISTAASRSWIRSCCCRRSPAVFPSPRSHFLCLSRWVEPAGCRGPRSAGARPEYWPACSRRRCPILRSRARALRLSTGSYPKAAGVTSSPPLFSHPHAGTPARPHARTNGNFAATATRPAATRTVAMSTLARPSPGCDGLWDFCRARSRSRRLTKLVSLRLGSALPRSGSRLGRCAG